MPSSKFVTTQAADSSITAYTHESEFLFTWNPSVNTYVDGIEVRYNEGPALHFRFSKDAASTPAVHGGITNAFVDTLILEDAVFGPLLYQVAGTRFKKGKLRDLYLIRRGHPNRGLDVFPPRKYRYDAREAERASQCESDSGARQMASPVQKGQQVLTQPKHEESWKASQAKLEAKLPHSAPRSLGNGYTLGAEPIQRIYKQYGVQNASQLAATQVETTPGRGVLGQLLTNGAKTPQRGMGPAVAIGDTAGPQPDNRSESEHDFGVDPLV